MNNIKMHIISYFTLGSGIFVASFTPNVLYPMLLRGLAFAFLICAAMFLLYYKSSYQRLAKPVAFLSRIPQTHLTVFFALFAIYKALEGGGLIIQSIIVGYTAFLILFLAVTRHFICDTLRPIFDRLNIFQPSVEIPKEFKNQGWGI